MDANGQPVQAGPDLPGRPIGELLGAPERGLDGVGRIVVHGIGFAGGSKTVFPVSSCPSPGPRHSHPGAIQGQRITRRTVVCVRSLQVQDHEENLGGGPRSHRGDDHGVVEPANLGEFRPEVGMERNPAENAVDDGADQWHNTEREDRREPLHAVGRQVARRPVNCETAREGRRGDETDQERVGDETDRDQIGGPDPAAAGDTPTGSSSDPTPRAG